jgi:hypothetical protein
MTFLTNAGVDDKIPPMLRTLLGHELDEQGRTQDWEADGKRKARDRVLDLTPRPLEAQEKIVVDGVEYDDAAPAFVFDEPEYDENVSYIVARMVECTWWPFKPKGSRAGWRPQMGPKAWNAVYDGYYCLRCRHRHDEQWPEECKHCHLTAEHRSRAFQHLEDVAASAYKHGPNREQRRALQRRSRGGVIIPSNMDRFIV